MGRASRSKRERRDLRQEQADWDGRVVGCLFCRSTSGLFTSREHAFPESLGNTEKVLPAGVVCDSCNNGPLSVLDQAICEFLPIALRRTMLGVPAKSGRVPSTRLTTGVVHNVGPASLQLIPHGTQPMLREVARDRDNVRLSMSWRGGRRMTPRYGSEMSRALLKTALELAWLDHGGKVLSHRFDHIRHAVLNRPRSGFFLVARTGDPDTVSCTLTYDLRTEGGVEGMFVIANYFGTWMATDSVLAEPPIDVDPHADVLTFAPDNWKAA